MNLKLRLSAVALTVVFAATAMAQSRPNGQRPGQRPGGQRPGGRRPADKLKVGDEAPDFTLKTMDGKGEETLSAYAGKKPVALVFGSYT